MKTLDDVKVGDTVILCGYRRGDKAEVTVTKVGTKLITVEQHRRDWKYRKDTGRINDNYGHSWIMTPETYADNELRMDLFKRLKGFGLEQGFGPQSKISTEKLKDIVSILEAG